jgi:hypothetical protein
MNNYPRFSSIESLYRERLLSRKALKGASFQSIDQLREAIETFIEVYQQNAKPFAWRKREVKGSQLKNTIVNLCN